MLKQRSKAMPSEEPSRSCSPWGDLINHEYVHHYDPLPLEPLEPLKVARRVRRHVRAKDGRIKERQVLEVSDASTENNHNPKTMAYTLDSIMCEQPKKGLAVFLASPMMPENSSPAAAAIPGCGNDNSIDEVHNILASGCPPPLVRCGGVVVIKAVRWSRLNNRRRPAAAVLDSPLAEISAMQYLKQAHPNHPNLITLLDCMQDDDYVYLVLPHLCGGDVFTRVEATDCQGLDIEETRGIFRDMVNGLHALKTGARLAHHDISLENVCFDKQGNAKIIDLGMCLRVPKPWMAPADSTACASKPVILAPRKCCGKSSYVAPEVVKQQPADPFASDIWSLGVCLYSMLTARPLYGSPDDQAFKIMSKGGIRAVMDAYEDYGIKVPSCAKDLLCLMLQGNPSQRPTLEEVIQHPFLNEEECS